MVCKLGECDEVGEEKFVLNLSIAVKSAKIESIFRDPLLQHEAGRYTSCHFPASLPLPGEGEGARSQPSFHGDAPEPCVHTRLPRSNTLIRTVRCHEIGSCLHSGKLLLRIQDPHNDRPAVSRHTCFGRV